MSAPMLADQAERLRAIHERARNVIVDAGAGTGKTTLLVQRILHLVAPEDDGPAFALDRVAAITFTRRAAGELKLRLREVFLAQASRQDLGTLRSERIARALALLDNALISTVHSFADRLLRLRPADARVSPDYEIAEDPTPFIDETFSWLLEAIARGTLASGLESSLARERAGEAADTVRSFQAAGLTTRTQHFEAYSKLGLDALVEDLVQTRDRVLTDPGLAPPDLASVQRCIDELARTVDALTPRSFGTRTLLGLREAAQRVLVPGDEVETLRRAVVFQRELERACKDLRKGEHFPGDAAGWEARRWIAEGKRGSGQATQERPGGPLVAAITRPIMAHMALRLVRLRPVVLDRYRTVKRSHGVLDQLDLLIALRDLLAGDRAARAFFQARFEHLLVDEFQDTDPLQAEIVSYLCEQGARAQSADEVVLAPGKLTIVGDPKQSIYRFRRADIAMYAAVCERLQRSEVCQVQLRVNFRSTGPLLGWLNQAFDAVLGSGSPVLDMQRGAVRNVHLAASDAHDEPDALPAVHVLPFGTREQKVDEARDLEGRALARYLRHLVEDGSFRIHDPRTRAQRRPGYGDIAVIMVATQTVHHLLSELDAIGVPHVIRGGTLFMDDPLHRQFVLGLRALADRRDGVARAALLRPPFFALTLADLARERLGTPTADSEQAAEIVARLRALRHRLTPGELGRRVLEQTGFGTYVAAGPNGPQRIARLYELCLYLDELARDSKLDFDGISEIARTWLETPTRIEAPLPIDADSIQVITAHQAKGLEWPVVALWDGRASMRAYLPPVALAVDAKTGDWALKLDALGYDPTERGLQEREVELREEERKRVVYVAATRARSLLIVPEAGEPRDTTIAGKLLVSTRDRAVLRLTPFEQKGEPWWESARGVSLRPLSPSREGLLEAWDTAAKQALTPRLAPRGISASTHPVSVAADDEHALGRSEVRAGRYGPVFGSAVHRALELLLSGSAPDAAGAAARAAREHGHDDEDAVLSDVLAAEHALRSAGLLSHCLQLEYPIAGALEPESLVAGYIDLIAVSDQVVSVIDYKTDPPPGGDVHALYPAYVAQVRAYGELLRQAGALGPRTLRCALLFTANGSLLWV